MLSRVLASSGCRRALFNRGANNSFVAPQAVVRAAAAPLAIHTAALSSSAFDDRGGGGRNNAHLSREISAIFTDRRVDPAKWLTDNMEYLNLYNVATLLRTASKHKSILSGRNLRRLSHVVEEGHISPRDESKLLGGLLYGLKEYKETDVGVEYMLTAILGKLKNTVTALDSQFFGNALYGMQHMSSSDPGVLAVVTEIARKMYLSQGEFGAQDISNSLYGLQSMNNNTTQVNHLLQALSLKISTSPDTLEPMQVGNALYGLQNMQLVTPELEGLWTCLTTHVQRCKGQYTSQHIGSAFFGLSSVSSFSSPALRSLLVAMNDSLQTIPIGQLDNRAVSTIMQGLRGADSQYEEVRVVIETTGQHLAAGKQIFSAKQVVRMMTSLAGFSSEHIEVRRMVGALANCFANTPTIRLKHTDLPLVVASLSDLSNSTDDVRRLFKGLLKMFPLAPKVPVSKLEHVYPASQMALLLHGLKSTSSTEEVGRRMTGHILNLIGPVVSCPPGQVKWHCTADDVLMALNSLQNKRGVDDTVHTLISLVNTLVKRSPAAPADFPPNELMRSLSCLESLLSLPPGHAISKSISILLANMSPGLVGAAAKTVFGPPVIGGGRREDVPLTPDELSRICNSLKYLSGDNGKVLASFIRVLKKYCRRFDSPLPPTALCRFLVGMTSMDWRDAAASGLLNELAKDRSGSALKGGNRRDGAADTITETLQEVDVGAAGDGIISPPVLPVLEGLFLSALKGCRRLSTLNAAGATVLGKLADLSENNIQLHSAEQALSVPPGMHMRCAALAGLRGFCDPLINAHLRGDMVTKRQIDECCTISNHILGRILDLRNSKDGSEDGPLLSPLQYGCILMSSTDLVELFLTSPIAPVENDGVLDIEGGNNNSNRYSNTLSANYMSFLLNLEAVLHHGNVAIDEWQQVLEKEAAVAAAAAEELERVAQGGKRRNSKSSIASSSPAVRGKSNASANVSLKRPVVTSSDVKLLRESLHIAISTFSRLAVSCEDMTGPTETLGVECRVEAVSALLARMSALCDQAVGRVDAKHTPAATATSGDMEDSVEGGIANDTAVSSSLIKVGGLTYAEKKFSNLRRRFRNFLADKCLTCSSDLVVPKVNPAIAGIFSTDIILSYDPTQGADLPGSIDMDAKLPYQHLLNPDMFSLYTAGNSSSIRNIVLNVEKKEQIYSSDCGLTSDDRLLHSVKYRFLQASLGADNVGHMWNAEEFKKEKKSSKEGFIQMTADEFKTKKLVFFNVSLDDFENTQTTKLFNTIMTNLEFVEKERPAPVVEEEDNNAPDPTETQNGR